MPRSRSGGTGSPSLRRRAFLSTLLLVAAGAASGCNISETLRPRSTIRPTVVASPTAGVATTPFRAATPTLVATATAVPSQVVASPTLTPVPSPRATPHPSLRPSPTVPTGPAVSVSRIKTTDKVVTLTYDAGADRGKADQLLKYLQSAGIHVTFGMTGRWAESNPDLVRQIAIQGHEFMNHTYDHRSWTGLSARPAVLTSKDRLAEIQQTETILQSLAGVSPRPLFRPPYGDQDASVLRDVGEAGYHYSILWTVDSTGWKGAPIKQIIDRCLNNAQPGAIYVMHVGVESLDIDATPQVVEGLRAKGYQFATVGEMLAAG